MKKIGIVTFHSPHNYGSVLQAYAMTRILQKQGLDAKIIDYRHPLTTAMYEFVWWSKERSLLSNLSNLLRHGILRKDKERERLFNNFINNRLPLTQRYNNKDEIKEDFDYLVCGSDQIWNPYATGKGNSIYYLNFGKSTATRFSYAVSSGGVEFAKGHENEIGTYLSALKRIGVRERGMQGYIDRTYHLKSYVNPDPTALLEIDDWETLEEPVNDVPNDYLLVYSIQKMNDTVLFAKEFGEKVNMPVIHINPSRSWRDHKIDNGICSMNDISPEQFLWLFHHASFIVTNTFHGNMFSIIYRRPFIWYTTDVNDERIKTLHEVVGLGESRQAIDVNKLDKSYLKLDYTSIEKNIKELKKRGTSYINECITNNPL